MKLPVPTPRYDDTAESQRNRIIEQADNLNYKKGQDVVVARPAKLIVYSDAGDAFEVYVSAAGVLGVRPA